MSKKIERLQIALDTEIAHHDAEAARLSSLLDECATDQQRTNLTSSWGFQQRNQMARINHARATLAYEIAAKAN